MQAAGDVRAQVHRLEVEAQLAFVQRIVDPAAPFVQALAWRCVVVVQAHPGLVRALRGLGQGLVGAAHHLLDILPRPVGGDAEEGHRAAVAGAGAMQVFLQVGELVGQVFRIIAGEARRE
ncbi:hypothetical protein D3C76_1535500 [compost metagenome]